MKLKNHLLTMLVAMSMTTGLLVAKGNNSKLLRKKPTPQHQNQHHHQSAQTPAPAPAPAPVPQPQSPAAWTMLAYIAADNTLADYAAYNINDMAAGLASTTGVNVLVQWDQPNNNTTWRYKIIPGGKIDAGSLTNSEMGYDPAVELVASMQWAITNYPANQYALILWDHGSGVEDFYPGTALRGVLYDDTQKTCLTNQGLTAALTQIKQMLGKNLDLIAMDACLMAMVEVTYQMKDLVNLFVGSQQTIPGNGYPYSKFINPLSLNPAGTSPLQLAQSMVSSYQQFYTSQQPTNDFTLAAIDVTSITLMKQNIDQFITAVDACSAIDATTTKNMIVAARQGATSFEMPEYIDLYSFYSGILNKNKSVSPKSHAILLERIKTNKTQPSQSYQDALNALNTIVQDGLTKITTIVLQSASGPTYSGVKGLSIYYPASGAIDPTYPLTLFAQDTAWINFIQQYR